MKNETMIIGSIVVAFVLIGIFTNGFGLLTGKAVDDPKSLSIGNSAVLGQDNAPITIYVFSDFSCPFCAAAAGENIEAMQALRSRDAAWEPPVPMIEEEYVATGKVKMVFKYYPGHGAGKPAQLVAVALQEQDPELFWKMHDYAFANQEETSDIVKMKAYAQSLGADMDALEKSLTSGRAQAQLDEDIAMARSIGIKGTPTFIINGEQLVGAQPAYEVKKVIEKFLSE